MKRLCAWGLCIFMALGLSPIQTMAAPEWPNGTGIQADGGIVIDADTGTVLSGVNIHKTYFPASITKLMTALLVIENCKMDEIVTFSSRAVNDVEEGSKSLGMVTGDALSVKDCLYGLLLHSSNETANALAEHVSGSIEDFAELMNKRAVELGCQNTHFANPSGLNNPDHYTSAYDMALIGKAVMQNETLMAIDSTLSYPIPPSKRQKNGQTVYPGHKMMKKSQPEYYPGVLGGKTGYTSLAGNTLVTFAQRDDMRLIVVILNGHMTHYSDTKALLDFGFKNFQSVKASDFDTFYSGVENDMSIAGLSGNTGSLLELDPNSRVTLPVTADFSDITSELTYQLPDNAVPGAVAAVNYFYDDRPIGTACLLASVTPEETSAALLKQQTEQEVVQAPPKQEFLWIIGISLLAVLVICGIILLLYLKRKRSNRLDFADRKTLSYSQSRRVTHRSRRRQNHHRKLR